jgi:hypothetical protein
MWQSWAFLYIGIWITYSGFLFGKPVKLHNICFGLIIVIFGVWTGLKARKLQQKGSN